ncbi:hypothetical protein C7M84_023275 [Penaeus vannamei]|uniref:Uncharacterized protein n=1 Tax=Penaeus vannamei TaxID=6689 RepID=A0A3R7MQW3_PENVA|nr:hypothetical protein C7M84_023275 [Penaeus vannamei]
MAKVKENDPKNLSPSYSFPSSLSSLPLPYPLLSLSFFTLLIPFSLNPLSLFVSPFSCDSRLLFHHLLLCSSLKTLSFIPLIFHPLCPLLLVPSSANPLSPSISPLLSSSLSFPLFPPFFPSLFLSSPLHPSLLFPSSSPLLPFPLSLPLLTPPPEVPLSLSFPLSYRQVCASLPEKMSVPVSRPDDALVNARVQRRRRGGESVLGIPAFGRLSASASTMATDNNEWLGAYAMYFFISLTMFMAFVLLLESLVTIVVLVRNHVLRDMNCAQFIGNMAVCSIGIAVILFTWMVVKLTTSGKYSWWRCLTFKISVRFLHTRGDRFRVSKEVMISYISVYGVSVVVVVVFYLLVAREVSVALVGVRADQLRARRKTRQSIFTVVFIQLVLSAPDADGFTQAQIQGA